MWFKPLDNCGKSMPLVVADLLKEFTHT